MFNLRRPMFQDRRVREAIGLLFDYEWTNKQLFYGAYLRTNSFCQLGAGLQRPARQSGAGAAGTIARTDS